MEAVFKRFPNSIFIANAVARVAVEGKDKEYARASLARLGWQWDRTIWNSYTTYAGRCAQFGIQPNDPAQMTMPHFIPIGPEAANYALPLSTGEALAGQVSDLFEREQFPELEGIAERLIRSHPERMHSFYRGMYDEDMHQKHDWEGRYGALRHWRKAYPDSSTAALAQADFLMGFAWRARGTEYADKVSKKAWALLRDRLEEGKAALGQVKQRDPAFYTASIKYLNATGGGDEEVEALALESQNRFPKDSELYSRLGYYYTPRWHGQHGVLLELARKMAAHEPKNAVYTLLALATFKYDKATIFEEGYPSHLPWGKVKAGLADLERLAMLDQDLID